MVVGCDGTRERIFGGAMGWESEREGTNYYFTCFPKRYRSHFLTRVRLNLITHTSNPVFNQQHHFFFSKTLCSFLSLLWWINIIKIFLFFLRKVCFEDKQVRNKYVELIVWFWFLSLKSENIEHTFVSKTRRSIIPKKKKN